MSEALSNLILVELQKINPNPLMLDQQALMANAIATAVATYMRTAVQVNVLPTATTPPLIGTLNPL